MDLSIGDPIKSIEVELSCDLTEEEIQHRAQELGGAIVEYGDVESRKKDLMKEFAEQLGAIRGRMRQLSSVVLLKSERRIVKCLVNFHSPTVGIKQIVRLDTGEVHAELKMSDEERQQHLFESPYKPN